METLRKEGETSLHVFLTMCQEKGIKPFQIISGKTNVSIPLELHAKLAQGAAAELFRPYWECPDIDIQEPADSPPEQTSIADEMDAIHETSRAWPLVTLSMWPKACMRFSTAC